MAFTPTDPTKAEVRVEQQGGQLGFDFYIPRGAKGEPGGFTLGTALDNAIDTGTGRFNLDDVKTSGIYRMTATNDNLLVRNYPRNYDTGILEVFERVPGQTIIQVWHSININSRVQFERAFVNGWQPWQTYASTRVSQTAGRAIYMWNDPAGLEQLIYGDTGWRDFSVAGETTKTFLRRVGHTVEFVLTNHASPGGNYVFPNSIPSGFRPTITREHPYREGAGAYGNTKMVSVTNGGTVTFWNSAAGAVSAACLWTTTESWPSALPGSAFGAIPNL